MNVPGPMGRTVTDVATLLTALTHTDAGAEESPAPAVAALQGEDFTQFLDLNRAKQQRVGVAVIPEAKLAELEALLANPPENLSAEVRAALQNAITLLQATNQGAKVAIAALAQ